jgi:hypothetical protein
MMFDLVLSVLPLAFLLLIVSILGGIMLAESWDS